MNLIVCCDGTWNTPGDMEGGQPSPTNVYKIHNAIAKTDKNGDEQKKYYHPGVGTDGKWWRRQIDGATGKGLDRNIQAAYAWLARNYQPGDKIFLFGFSRGAYTVRSLGGMVSKCGLLDIKASKLADPEVKAVVAEIFAEYRVRPEPKTKTDKIQEGSTHFHNVAPGGIRTASTPIECIGVWDTVGALGIPDDLGFLNLLDNPKNHQFHDTELGDAVRHAFHAVALDEFRQSFMPTLWKTPNGWTGTLRQVWFPGVHGDVGGGYASCGLSDGALKWMIKKAESLQLEFDPAMKAQIRKDHLGVLHDSVSGIFARLKTRPRATPNINDTVSAKIHLSAHKRHGEPSILQGKYRETITTLPATVEIFARDRWNATGIFLTKGVTYQFSAKGTWTDSNIVADADGKGDGKVQLSKIVRSVATVWGFAERSWKKLSGNRMVDWRRTRREEDHPWFSLIGVIANDVPPPERQARRKNGILELPHEVFKIGTGVPYTPKADGYLYCFANDAWQTYENNRGSVKLTVSAPAPQKATGGAIAPAAQRSTPAS